MAPWWVLPGLVVGLVASCFIIIYWFYRLRSMLTEKSWRYTSHLWVLVWIAVFFGSAGGLLRMSTAIQEGSIMDGVLLYTSATLYWIAPVALVAGMILDVVVRRANSHNQ